MPQFSRIPALEARVADIPGAFQQGRRDVQLNQLNDMKLQREMSEVQRQGQFGQHVPGILQGDQEAIGQAAALDPAMTAKYLDVFSKMDARTRAQKKQQYETAGNLLLAVENAPLVQRPTMYAMALERAQRLGLPMDEVPETYDQKWVRMEIAELGQFKQLLDQAETAKAPTGYRRTDTGVELIPGYLEGEKALSATGAGGGRTALQKDVPYIAKLAGISMQEALALKLESKDKSYDAYVRDLAARYASAGYGADRAFEQATAIGELAYGRAKPPEAAPESKEGRSWLQELLGFGGGESAASGGRGAAKKGSQENPHTPETQADFDAIPSGEVYLDDQKLYRKP